MNNIFNEVKKVGATRLIMALFTTIGIYCTLQYFLYGVKIIIDFFGNCLYMLHL